MSKMFPCEGKGKRGGKRGDGKEWVGRMTRIGGAGAEEMALKPNLSNSPK